jgi:tight adherence protein B
VFEALLKGSEAGEALRPTRNIRRAQQYALEAVSNSASASRAAILQRQIAAAGLSWTVGRFLMICLAAGAAVFAPLAMLGIPLAIATPAGIAAAWMLPRRLLTFFADRRKRCFLDAFGAAVDMIVRGAKSGLSLMDCLAIVAGDAEEPVRSEFEAMLSQLRAGVPMAVAMDKLSAVMPVPEVRFLRPDHRHSEPDRRQSHRCAGQSGQCAARPAQAGDEGAHRQCRGANFGHHHRRPALCGDRRHGHVRPSLYFLSVDG